YHSVALKQEGTVVVWGGLDNSVEPPAGLRDVVAISAGTWHTLAVKHVIIRRLSLTPTRLFLRTQNPRASACRPKAHRSFSGSANNSRLASPTPLGFSSYFG